MEWVPNVDFLFFPISSLFILYYNFYFWKYFHKVLLLLLVFTNQLITVSSMDSWFTLWKWHTIRVKPCPIPLFLSKFQLKICLNNCSTIKVVSKGKIVHWMLRFNHIFTSKQRQISTFVLDRKYASESSRRLKFWRQIWNFTLTSQLRDGDDFFPGRQ